MESDWKKGSTVVWKMKPDIVCVKGTVTVVEPNARITSTYSAKENPQAPGMDEDYAETFTISLREGKTIIGADSGPIAKKWALEHAPMWDKAVLVIKELAEKL